MANCVIGIDLGGTKTEVALIDSAGQITDSIVIPTGPDYNAETIIENIVDQISDLQNRNPGVTPVAIGIGIAGQVEGATGKVIYAPNLEWHNVQLADLLSEKTGCSVMVTNDVRAATYGEWKLGAGKGCDDIVCIFAGTGIGGGIISNGEILTGFHNTAGEVGHMTIDMHGPVCHCGNIGCFEAIAGGWAIERDARAAVQQDNLAGSALLEITKGDINAITAKTVGAAAQNGDPLSIKLMDNAADAMIAGVVSVVNAIGPHRLILGGGIIEGTPALVGIVDKGVRKFALKAVTAQLEILPAALHNSAGVVGAAMLALYQFQHNKSHQL